MGGSFNGVFDSEVAVVAVPASSSPASTIEGVAAAAASTDAIVDETSVAADPVMNVRRSGILSAEDARVIDHAAVSASKFLIMFSVPGEGRATAISRREMISILRNTNLKLFVRYLLTLLCLLRV